MLIRKVSMLLFFFCFTNNAFALAQTMSYWQAGPNSFWQRTTFEGLGNDAQKQSKANNPDVFCQSLGENWYLPSAGEYSRLFSKLNIVNKAGTEVLPGAKENYTNNNDASESNRKAVTGEWNTAARGALFSEWGDTAPIPINTTLWVKEVQANTSERRTIKYLDRNIELGLSNGVQVAACMQNIPVN